MTIANRAFLGAIFGAIIALFLHPLSRPWLQYSFYRFSPSPTAIASPHLAKTLRTLQPPKDDENLSLYVQVAAEKIASGELNSGKDTLLLAELCRNAADKDPLNAFWRQSEAVFQYALGNKGAAKTAWSRASKRPTWNDFQSQQIKDFLKEFAAESGTEMSWQSAVAIQLRSSAVPKVTTSLGRTLLNEDQSQINRAETFLNAILIRDQARTTSGSEYGYRLAETAATGPLKTPGSKRDKSFTRAEFPTDLYKSNHKILGDQIAKGLQENDAFQALVYSADTNRNLSRLTGQSILLASMPGALLFGAIITGILLFVAYLVPLHKFGDPVNPIVPTACALIFATGIYLLTHQITVSLWSLLVIALFAIHPPINLISPNLKVPRLNYLFGAFIAVFFSALIVAAAVVAATPFQTLAPSLPEGWWNDPTGYFTQVILIVVGSFILFNQITAYRLRRPAGRFCIIVARQSLAQASLACLFSSIILTPAAIYWDNKINQDLQKIALNETAYYLNR
ncbi:MAG: hypothetical protein ACKVQS_08715 [Fimbriimonadaceae bacterium]